MFPGGKLMDYIVDTTQRRQPQRTVQLRHSSGLMVEPESRYNEVALLARGSSWADGEFSRIPSAYSFVPTKKRSHRCPTTLQS